jgi:hypothetical protein
VAQEALKSSHGKHCEVDVIALVVTVLIGWLIFKLLWSREPVYIEPPPPLQIIIHLHQPRIVVTGALVTKAD